MYIVESSGNGNWTSLAATSYKKARKIAASQRNAFHTRVKIIKGEREECDRCGVPTNVVDMWATNGEMRNGKPRWVRVGL